MDEGHEMYEMQFPAPDVGPKNGGLTMVVALQGYADAGLAVAGSAGHLIDALDHRPLVNFNNDELVDYRSRRPAVTMVGDAVADCAELELSLQVVRDNAGKPFLLLSGPEPDLRWDAFSQAVADLVERFDVRRTVSLYSAPMTVPHTRPLGIIAHGNDRELLAGHRTWGQRVTVPGAASLRIELELNRRGRTTCGFTAQVPHYVAASDYPLAALRLLEAVADAGDLEFPLTALERESDKVAELLAEQARESEEVAGIVRMLEHQHDEEERRRSTLESNPLVRADGSMPSADELGAEFERFLATQIAAPERDDEPTSGSPAEPVVSDDSVVPDDSGESPEDARGHDDATDARDAEDTRDAEADETGETDGDERGGRPPRRPWFRF
ncbi:MAG TPA: PAC2 family protein [Corynebacterium xerosis]|uniref:PAC2 family protein n=1 Tax=Corynebacterium xerosis TaxID=1725 RepID=UPI001D3252D0|nr:PAC2 family protein [Corynebacterium xerosis]HJG57986.1 PAC2 family protein [Corynebacterium xerosis]